MPDTLATRPALENNIEVRCGICQHYEPNFSFCQHPDISISVEEKSKCNNPCLFEEDT